MDHASGSRVVTSISKRPYGLTYSPISGVRDRRSVVVRLADLMANIRRTRYHTGVGVEFMGVTRNTDGGQVLGI